MKVPQRQLRKLHEVLQREQLRKVAKLTQRDATYLLNALQKADPTARNDPMKGKYASWLLARLAQAVKQENQAEWLRDNPEKAFEQGLLQGHAEIADWANMSRDDQLRSIANLADDTANALEREAGVNYWLGSEEEMHELLSKYHKLAERGWLQRTDFPKDIRQIESVQQLKSLRDLGMGPLDYVAEHPGNLVFDVDYSDNGVYIISTDDPDTAKQLGKDGGWCFGGDEAFAHAYTEEGYLFFLYVDFHPEYLVTRRSKTFTDLFAAAAISPHSTYYPDARTQAERPDLFEIRDVVNKWLYPEDLTEENALQPVIEVITRYRETEPNAALGFEVWLQKGTFNPKDLQTEIEPEQQGSEIARDITQNYGIPVDNGLAIVAINGNLAVDVSNYRYLTSEYYGELRYDSESVWLPLENDNRALWHDLAMLRSRQPLDQEDLERVKRGMETYWWGRPFSRENRTPRGHVRFETAFLDAVSHIDILAGVPIEVWTETMDLSDLDRIRQLETLGYQQPLFDWPSDLDRRRLDINSEIFADIIENPADTEQMRQILGVPTMRDLRITQETLGSRLALRRMMLGRR